MQCIFNNYPKKYYSSSLKVILMFNITDPYKLVYNASKYKINELTNSYYYLTITDAYYIHHRYHVSGMLEQECITINNMFIGRYCTFYESGKIT